MALVSGVEKRVVVSKETTWGVLPATNTGKELRRVTSEFNLERANFQSAEITSTAQTSDSRNGTDSIAGTLNGELSPGSYSDIFASLLRGTWAAAVTSGAQITIAGASGKFVRSAGSWLTDGFKAGDMVAVSGFTTTGLANNDNWLVVAVTATDLSVVNAHDLSKTVAVKAEGDSVTVAGVGKKLAIPLTLAGRTNESYTVEEYLAPQDEAYLTTGVKFGSAAVQIQPNSMTTVNFSAMGRTQELKATAGEYFTAPTAASTAGIFSGNKGIIVVDGVAQAIVTGINFEITGNMETSLVVGNRQAADISLGRITATGEATLYYENGSIYNKFKNDEDISLFVFMEADTGEYMVIKFPRIRLGGANRDDKEVGNLIQTVPFTALLPKGTDPSVEQSTVVIIDSLA